MKKGRAQKTPAVKVEPNMFVDDLEERTPDDAKVVNVAVKYLRQNGYKDLHEWQADPNNVYVGRRNHYVGVEGSKWANPFPVGQRYDIRESLKLYKQHIIESGLVNQLNELQGKNLGCWCVNNDCKQCHAIVLAQMLHERLDSGEIERKGRMPEKDIAARVNDQIVGQDQSTSVQKYGIDYAREIDIIHGPEDEEQLVFVEPDSVPDDQKLHASAPEKEGRQLSKVAEEQMKKLHHDALGTLEALEAVNGSGEHGEESESDNDETNSLPATFFGPPIGKKDAVEYALKNVQEKFPDLTVGKQEMLANCWYNKQMYGSVYTKPIEGYLKRI